jgi:hypothetical protein
MERVIGVLRIRRGISADLAKECGMLLIFEDLSESD